MRERITAPIVVVLLFLPLKSGDFLFFLCYHRKMNLKMSKIKNLENKQKYLVIYGQGSDETDILVEEYTEQEIENKLEDGFGWRHEDISCIIPYDWVAKAFDRFESVSKIKKLKK